MIKQKHLQEELKSKDKIINQVLNLIDNIANKELHDRTNIIKILIDASIYAIQKSCKIGTKTLDSEKIDVKNKR